MKRAITQSRRSPARQRGGFLLEGLIALLIFAFGILGLIGLMAQSIRASGEAKYRVEAVNLANAMIGDMWTTHPGALDSQFGTGGTKLADWQALAGAVLPSATGANAPQVDLTQPGLSLNSRSVVVTVFWQLPGESERHQVLLTAQIGKNS